MANGVINIDFSTIESCASRIAQEVDLIQLKINEIHNCYSSLDGRVKTQLGGEFDTGELETIKTRLEKTKTFLEEVKKVYSGADIDLSSSLSVDYLEYLYPYFKDLSDERKAIVLSCLRYLGLNGSQMSYAKNFTSQFASSQFVGDTSHAWCAMFVGSIINYFYGNKSIIDPSYASVWKIIGNYQNQTGIAFETDDRIHYYVSQAMVDKYKAMQERGINGISNWESNLSAYNQKNGTNLKATDWINDGFIPQAGDIITFKSPANSAKTMEDYNNRVNQAKAAFIGNNQALDYPNSTGSYTHIGFVLGTREVDGVTYVDTIEGNVSDDVQVRSFRIDDPYLVGYGHIEYEKFESDKNAIQQMLATGVDTNASKATAGSMSQHLLALKTGDLRGNYLVNLANNIDKAETQNLVLNQTDKNGQISNLSMRVQEPVATTQTQTYVNTGTQTYQNTYHNSYSNTGYYSNSGKSSYIHSKTSQSTVTQTKSPSVETVTVNNTQTVVVPQETVPVVTQMVVEQKPVVVETPVTYPQVDSSPVNIPVVEETPVIPTVSVEETTPIFVPNEEVIYAQDQLNPAKPQEIPIPTVSNPIQVIPTEATPTIPPKSSNFGKILLTTLGVGAGAGGAYYLSQKIKKNREDSEEEEYEFEEEEEYDDEY